ncbi:MAG TPA: efflux RND transporter periplasmic adaptor subunit [Candidatus Binataceae bacterium]|nr:efflux RND transporter periplasmic adaptor subunit [Candidatus Binataceae bacterium]
MEDDPKNYIPPPPGALFYTGWIVGIVALVIITLGMVMAHGAWLDRQTAELQTQAALGPHVLVVPVTQAPTTRQLKLPASVRGYEETDIFAKVPGYLKVLKVDKGDRVTKGQLLAVIESPETDQAVENARANYHLALLTDNRNQILLKQQVVPQQTADETHASMLQAKATLDQELALQKYEIINAPFDGIISARNIDPGHLVAAPTTSSSSSDAIVTIARIHPVRVYSYVPQNTALYIRNGDAATITFYEFAHRAFSGTITRHPEALSPDSRTMLVEVDLPNEDDALLPGLYGQVTFTVRGPAGAPLVPDDALVFRNDKVYVPIARDNRLHLQEVTLGYDNGVLVEALTGVNVGDQVAVNVGQAAHDGESVQPVPAQP